MIRTSQLDAICREVADARHLVEQLRQVRAADPASALSIGGPAAEVEAHPMLVELPAALVAEGLLKQLRLVAARLATGRPAA